MRLVRSVRVWVLFRVVSVWVIPQSYRGQAMTAISSREMELGETLCEVSRHR